MCIQDGSDSPDSSWGCPLASQQSTSSMISIIGMVEILPLSLWMLDVGITIIPRVDFEAALLAGVDGAHCHGFGRWVELVISQQQPP